MTHSTFLVEYEIDSHGVFEGVSELKFKYPHLPVSITLREKSVDLNQEYAILSAYVVLDADSMEVAYHAADDVLSEFIHSITFATSMDFQIGRKLKVIEWASGLEERNCWIIQKFPGDDRPWKVLNDELVLTVNALLSEDIPSPVRRAIRWFSIAVSAKYMDEQFQCFWFAAEILAQVIKPVDKVNDLCPESKCREPLYCKKCGEYPMHRPYAKQAIHYLFTKVISDKPDEAFKTCNEVRNCLLHGKSIEEIESGTGRAFNENVDGIGRVAWYALRNMVKQIMLRTGQSLQLNFFETNTFCEIVGEARAHMSYRPKDPDNPEIGEWPELKIEVNRAPGT